MDFRNLLAIVRSAVTEYSETQGRALASMELLSEAVRLLDAALAEEPR